MQNKETGQCYVGRSCDVFRRIREHQGCIRKGVKTVGQFIHSMNQMEFCVFELPKDSTNEQMRYYEQTLLANVKAEKGSSKVMNKINAMNKDSFEQMERRMQM